MAAQVRSPSCIGKLKSLHADGATALCENNAWCGKTIPGVIRTTATIFFIVLPPGRKPGAQRLMVGKPLRTTKQYSASDFFHSTVALPLAQQSAGREWRDVCRIGQLLIGDIEVDSIRIFPANTTG
jgi:hypothetical protein